MFRITRSKMTQPISSRGRVITNTQSAHVRWPARPAELRAGLDFSFVSFLCIKTKKRKQLWLFIKVRRNWSYLQKKSLFTFFCVCKRILRQAQDKIPKEKHTGNDPDSYRDSHCRTPWFSFGTTVNCAKQFLSSTSTIVEVFLFPRYFP